nr:hypothetical protein [Saccharopolyspora hordei]
MSKVEGYHGIKPDHYNDVVNGNGVSRPTEGTAGNSDPDWKGWYLAEDKTEAAAFSWNDEGPGAVLKYETPGPVTVHQVPHELTSTLNGPVDPAKMNALKQHFGVGNQPLVDGLAGQNGVIRTQDGEGGMFEYIVPWDTATGGRVTVEGYPDMGNEVKPRPRSGNGLFGMV